MNIYIMSRGRAGKVNTLKWIPESWRDRTYLVVSRDEAEDYALNCKHFKLDVVPASVTNYSEKVQYLLDMDWDGEKGLIMDDDLVFSSRSNPDKPNSLISITDPEVLVPMYEQIEQELSVYPLVGVHPRQMGQNTTPPHALNGRIICIQGINRRLIGKVKVDQYPILADVVLNCTLLGRGQPNSIITTYFQDHGPCQAPGGCSIYRTPAMQRDAVDYLAGRWPDFVTAVERRPKVAKWMGDVRYEYTCQWKRLFAAGRAHLLDPGKNPSPDQEERWAAKAVEQ